MGQNNVQTVKKRQLITKVQFAQLGFNCSNWAIDIALYIMKRLIECLLLLCLLSACKERSIIQPDDLSTVKVEVSGEIKQQPLSEISDYSLLFLPTADSLVIGEINRIRSVGDYVYLSDNSTIYKFSRLGDFVARISKHGAGNGEYLNITDFQIDGMGNVWILSRTMQALLLYSWDNSLLRKI